MKLLTKIWLAGLITTAMSISAFGACNAEITLAGAKITNLGTPTAGSDVVTASFARAEISASSDFDTVKSNQLCSSLGEEWTLALSADPIIHNELNGSPDPDLTDWTVLYVARNMHNFKYKNGITQYLPYNDGSNIADTKICVKY